MVKLLDNKIQLEFLMDEPERHIPNIQKALMLAITWDKTFFGDMTTAHEHLARIAHAAFDYKTGEDSFQFDIPSADPTREYKEMVFSLVTVLRWHSCAGKKTDMEFESTEKLLLLLEHMVEPPLEKV